MAKRIKKSKFNNVANSWQNSLDAVRFANSSVADNLSDLKVPSLGLTEKYIAENSKKVNHKAKFPLMKTILDSFKDPFTLLLVAIIIYNFVMYGININNPKEDPFASLAGGILVTLVVGSSVVFDVFTNRSIFKSNASSAVHDASTAKVLRNVVFNNSKAPIASKEVEDVMIQRLTDIKANQLLIGDIIYLKKGDVIPTDARIIYSTGFTVNQEVLSGDMTPVSKRVVNSSLSNNPLLLNNIIYRGTTVVSGTAWAIVIYKGLNTLYQSKVIQNIPPKEKSTFNEKLKKVTKILMTTMMIFVPFVFILTAVLNGTSEGFDHPEIWLNSFVFAMAIAVALSPDALPFMLNAVFARSRIVLSRNQINISNLSSVQNVGAMNTIAIDIDKIFLNDDIIIDKYSNVEGYNDNKIIDYLILSVLNDQSVSPKLKEAIINSPSYSKQISDLKSKYEFKDEIINKGERYFRYIDKLNNQILLVKKSYSVDAIQNAVLYDDGKGNVVELTPIKATKLINSNNYSNNYQSCGISYLFVPNTEENLAPDYKVDPAKIIYLGNIEFVATVKAGSGSIINQIIDQQIAPVLITRQILNQALDIAEELDFKVNKYLSGKQVDNMTDDQLIAQLKSVNMFYAISINTQIRLIKVFKKQGTVIGYLGKDVDDSIQMLVADVGITLDNSDTYGKQCASLIISHLDLMQLITAIRESRKALINMMKYIKIKVTGVTSLVMKLIIGICMVNHEPMSATQLLIQNLIYDAVEYSIAFDKVNIQFVSKPVEWNTKSIIPFAVANDLIIVLLNTILVLLTMFVMYPGMFEAVRHGTSLPQFTGEEGPAHTLQLFQTIYFVEDSISHLVFIFVARGNHQNWWQERPGRITFWSLFAGICFFIVITLIPGVNEFFGTQTLKWYWYFALVGEMIIMMFMVDQVKKFTYTHKMVWL